MHLSHLVGVVAALAHHARAAETRGGHARSLLVARHVPDLVDVFAAGCFDLALVVALSHPG